MALLKQKGDLAELKVTADLVDRGCSISFPFGEDCDYDLIADMEGSLHRVQVKYTESNGEVINVRCRSHSLTNGKIRQRSTTQQKPSIGSRSTTEPQIAATTSQPANLGTGGACFIFAWPLLVMASA